MTDNQTKAFILTAAKVREIKCGEARMREYAAEAKRAARWRFNLHQRHTQAWLNALPTKVPFYMTGEEIVFFVLYVGLAVAVVGFAVYLCVK